jgi:SAM-dependent methyltransferase
MQDSEYHAMAALEERHWWYRSLRSRVLARLEVEARRLGRPLEVFDAGCGTGGLLLALRGQPWIAAASGCDGHPVALAYARSRGLTVSEASVNDLGIGPGRFDVVLSMDVIYQGPPMQIAFNPEFLQAPLRALDSEHVYLDLIDEMSPGVLRIEGTFLYVLMPMRVTN